MVRALALPPSLALSFPPSLPGSDSVPPPPLTHCSEQYTNAAPVPNSQKETFRTASVARLVAARGSRCLRFFPGGGGESAEGRSKRKSVPR